MNKLKVGVIIDNGIDSPLLDHLVFESSKTNKFIVKAIIKQSTPKADSSFYKKVVFLIKSRGIKRFLRDVSFKFLEFVEFKLFKIFTNFSLKKINNLSINNVTSIHVRPIVSKSGFIYKYKKEDLKKISDLDLDILIRGGSGILRGEILDLCKFGILSFHHADSNVNRGGPPAFWEVYNHEPSTGFIIQKLSEELDGGDVLLKGSIGTSLIYSLNYYKLMSKSNIFLSKLLINIAEKKKLPNALPKIPYYGKLYSTPKISQQIIYSYKTIVRAFIKIYDTISQKGMRWSVAYQFTSKWNDVSLRKSKIIRNPPNRFYADPFIISHLNRNICFVEDYCYKKSIGRISAIEITENGYNDLGIVLEEKFHLSFPFIFKVNNVVYMCPETYQSNEIRLYKCTEFPLKWELHKVIMKNVTAMDTIIFKDNNKWWLMTNVDSSPLMHEGSELHLFHSDSFDSDNWQPHQENPVIFSSDKGRNAGFLLSGNSKYRVYQKTGFGIYGRSMGVAQIKKLSQEEYVEQDCFEIKPDFFDNILGTHTFSHSDDLLVFDFVKKEKIGT